MTPGVGLWGGISGQRVETGCPLKEWAKSPFWTGLRDAGRSVQPSAFGRHSRLTGRRARLFSQVVGVGNICGVIWRGNMTEVVTKLTVRVRGFGERGFVTGQRADTGWAGGVIPFVKLAFSELIRASRGPRDARCSMLRCLSACWVYAPGFPWERECWTWIRKRKTWNFSGAFSVGATTGSREIRSFSCSR